MKKNIIYFEYLRCFAIIGVLSIHIVADMVTRFQNVDIVFWWIAHSIDSLSRWCVPIFIMISGALLLNPKRDESIIYFYKNRFIKILIPFFVALLFYFIYKHFNNLKQIYLYDALKELLKGPVYFHLWYVYMLIGLLAVTPILRIFIRHCEKKHIHLFLCFWIFILANKNLYSIIFVPKQFCFTSSNSASFLLFDRIDFGLKV